MEVNFSDKMVEIMRILEMSKFTLEPAAFQVKGTFREINENKAYVEIDRVYTCSLPKPGERVDIPILERMPRD